MRYVITIDVDAEAAAGWDADALRDPIRSALSEHGIHCASVTVEPRQVPAQGAAMHPGAPGCAVCGHSADEHGGLAGDCMYGIDWGDWPEAPNFSGTCRCMGYRR